MNKQELIKRIEVLPYTEGPIADTITINRNWILESIKQLDEPETGHADEAPRYVKNILARLRELPLHNREVWLKAITGDFGELVAVNFNNMGSWEDFYKDFTNNAGYFIEKIKASSRNLFVYDEDEAKKIILEYFFDNKRYEDLDENDRYYFDELFEYFDDRHGFKHITDTVREFLSEQDSEYYETLEFAGKKVSEIVLLYLDAYKRAYESIKNEEME